MRGGASTADDPDWRKERMGGMETGDVLRDLDILRAIMGETNRYIREFTRE